MPLDHRIIQAALHFLGRAQITGNEVPDFVAVTNALSTELTIAQLPKQPAPPPAGPADPE